MNFVVLSIVFQIVQYLCEARLVWKNDIRISSSDFEEDLEQIPSKLLASLGLLVDRSKLERFDSLIDNQPEAGEEYKEMSLTEYSYHIDYGMDDFGKLPSKKRQANGKDYDTTEDEFINGTVTEVDYNLEEFKRDYDSRLPKVPDIATVQPINNSSVVLSEDDRAFQATESDRYSQTCLKMSFWLHLVFGIPCIVHETLHFSTGSLSNIIIYSFKTILSVVPSIFLLLLGCWCYNGMCSCFFPLEFFHPYSGIIKIKKDAYRIPPGVYVEEDGTISDYPPTEEEKKVYEELLKLIRS